MRNTPALRRSGLFKPTIVIVSGALPYSSPRVATLQIPRLLPDHKEEIEYHEYLQWQADLQLAKAQEVAQRLGLSIGLYQDLAVGIAGHGADAWIYRDALIKNVSVGAPPIYGT